MPQGDEQFVFRVVDGKAARAKVEIGQRRDGKVEVVNGLDADDMVVTAGQLKLRDGTPVTIARRRVAASARAAPSGAQRAAGQARTAAARARSSQVLMPGATAMQLPEICIKRPVFATVLSLIILLIGLISYTRLSVREYPRIDEPVVSVSTSPIAARRPKWSSRR